MKLKELRQQKAQTQKELAKEAGISLNSLRRYEQGERSPTAETLCNLAKALQTTPNELIGFTEEETKRNDRDFND